MNELSKCPIEFDCHKQPLQRACVIFLQPKAADSQGVGLCPHSSGPWLQGTPPWRFLLWPWASFHACWAPSRPLSLFLEPGQAPKETTGEEDGYVSKMRSLRTQTGPHPQQSPLPHGPAPHSNPTSVSFSRLILESESQRI